MSDYIGRHDHERGAPITADCDSWCACKADRYAEQQKPAMPSNPPSARMTERPPRYGWLACIVGGVMLMHLSLLCVVLGHFWTEGARAFLLGLAMVGIGIGLRVIDTGLWRFQLWLTK